MSHTTKIGDVAFIHDGDFSGDVEIVVPKAMVKTNAADNRYRNLVIPMKDLVSLVAGYVRDEKIRRLENTEDNEVLGIPEER